MFCPICRLSNLRFLGKVDIIDKKSSDRVDLFKCSSCGHWFHYPIPNQCKLNQMYKIGDPKVTTGDEYNGESKKINSDPFFKIISNELNSTGAKRINYLEIGVGKGLLFKEMEKRFNCYGVEPSSNKIEKNIFNDISELPIDLIFDVIICQDVIEHLENPMEYLKYLKKHSNNKTIIYCSFPKSDSMIAKIMGKKWRMIRPFGHLHYFSKKSAIKLFESAGWNIIKFKRLNAGIDLGYLFKGFKIKKIIGDYLILSDQMIVLGINS